LKVAGMVLFALSWGFAHLETYKSCVTTNKLINDIDSPPRMNFEKFRLDYREVGFAERNIQRIGDDFEVRAYKKDTPFYIRLNASFESLLPHKEDPFLLVFKPSEIEIILKNNNKELAFRYDNLGSVRLRDILLPPIQDPHQFIGKKPDRRWRLEETYRLTVDTLRGDIRYMRTARSDEVFQGLKANVHTNLASPTGALEFLMFNYGKINF
jgi:hypothetical protein